MSQYLTKNNSTDSLLPCAHCGGEAEWRDGSSTRPYIRCKKCGMRTGSSYDYDKLRDTWNARAKRTCKSVCNSVSEFTCSACGFACDITSWISLFDGDSGRHRHHHYGMPNYCPNCWARVVEVDE